MRSREDMVIPAHSLVESYAVMTRLPAPHRVAPADAVQLLRENFADVKIVTQPARAVLPISEAPAWRSAAV